MKEGNHKIEYISKPHAHLLIEIVTARIRINQASAERARSAIAGVRTVIATHDESYERSGEEASKSFLAAF